MQRSTIATINLSAIRHNLQRAKALAPSSKTIAVVKANAYGHGVKDIVPALDDITDAFGVSCMPEALEVRQYTQKQIVVLQGHQHAKALQLASEHNFRVVVHDLSQLSSFDSIDGTVSVAVKIDSGMHRLGLDLDSAADTIETLINHPNVNDNLWLMSHFASADDIDSHYTPQQIKIFDAITKQYPYPKTLSNSAGVITWPDAHHDWIRPGIMLYGSTPMMNQHRDDHDLKAVMTLSAPLIAVHNLKKGDPIGYGNTWCCPKDMKVGVVACGYADGYPRHAPTGTRVWVNNQYSHLLGRVSMDMIVIDLNNVTAYSGDTVELWGENVSVDEVAQSAETISYELLCNAGNNCPHQIL